MKVLLINGSPHEKGCTYTALKEVAETLQKEGVGSEIYWIGRGAVSGCTACGACKKSGKCVFGDVNALNARMEEFGALVVGSPVYYAGPNASLTGFLDRLFYSGGDFSGKLGAAVVSCRRGGASASFDRLNKYFTIKRMPIVSSQYWNQVHGNTPEEVERDEEGMQTMRTLARELAWLLKCIEAGRAAGVERPAEEPFLKTNFIR